LAERDHALDGVFDPKRRTRAQAELGRILIGSMLRHRHFGVEGDLAGIQTLEQQIERHDLGERRRMAESVGARRRQHRAGIAIHDDGGEFRAVAAAVVIIAGMMHGVTMMVVTPGVGAAGRCHERRSDGDEPKNANSHLARGSRFVAKHEFPVPVSDLIIGS